MMKKLSGLIIILIHLNTWANATSEKNSIYADDDKPGIITGVIIDVLSQQPMEYANIAIYNKTDSTLVTGGITDEKGQFPY